MIYIKQTLLHRSSTPTPTPTPTSTPSGWTASAGFSNTQGQSQWRYKEWNGSSYSDLLWDTGNNDRWYGSQTFCLIANNWQHPQGSAQSARQWVAPSSGTVTITGNPRMGGTGGNGVVVRIKKGTSDIWGSYTISAGDTTGLNHNFSVSVTTGDTINFILADNGEPNFDTTYWDPNICYTRKSYINTNSNTHTRWLDED